MTNEELELLSHELCLVLDKIRTSVATEADYDRISKVSYTMYQMAEGEIDSIEEAGYDLKD